MIGMKRASTEKVRKALKVKAKIDNDRPDFIRSEHTRFPRLGKKWRSSKGIRSKMRIKKRSRAPIVETGYRGPALVRGLRADGKSEVMVFRVDDLAKVDKETQVVRISGLVGKRKRSEILDKAKSLEIKVLNKRPSELKAEEPKAEEEEAPMEEVKEEAADEEEEAEEEAKDKEEAKEKPKPKPKPKKAKPIKKEKPPEPAKEELPAEEADEEEDEE
jgi:large subunit ribosomal protein L32e